MPKDDVVKVSASLIKRLRIAVESHPDGEDYAILASAIYKDVLTRELTD